MPEINFNHHRVAVSQYRIKYMVDPNNETVESSVFKPSEIFQGILKEHYMHSYIGSWVGHYGSNGEASPLVWEENITDSHAFIYYGLESFASQVRLLWFLWFENVTISCMK